MSTNSISYRQILLSYLCCWGFWILMQAIILHRLQWSWEVSLTDAAISNTLLAIAGYVTGITYRFYRPGGKSRLQRLGWVVALTFVLMFTQRLLLMQVFSGNASYLDFLERSMPLRYTFSFLIIAFMTLISWLWFYAKEQEENSKRKGDVEKLLRDAELRQLRQQLQPHFLFNSLNSISALAGSKPQEARKMIQQLSDFLRGTLKKDEQQLVNLSEELQHLNLYLEIEKVRFGQRLNAIIHNEGEISEMKLPTLLLQPLVENAIKFGLYDTIGEVTITINARSEQNNLLIEITNPFDPDTAKTKPGVGFGLSSVQRRLNLIYARQDLLATEAKENLFITKLKIPQLQ